MRRTVLIVMLAATLLAVGAATASAAPTERSFKAKLDGTASVMTLSSGLNTLSFQGNGHASTGVGKLTFAGGLDFIGTFGSGCVSFSGGALILTTEKGGQLVLHPVPGAATACGTGRGADLDVSMTLDIGTGRFDGVTGRGTLTGTLRPRSDGYTFTGTLDATMTSPAGH